MDLIKVEKINKSFGKKHVLKDVSFNMKEGEILGFIGPNGAGKTTTIKLILGLQSVDSGEVYINGFSIKKDFEKAIANVGAIVESPDLYMYLSGRDNLKIIARMYKNIRDSRIEEVVKLVGLENRINDKVSKYSLGMRQRLGIASTLLINPKILILDEPTNGLDPEGIKEIRDLLKNIAVKEKIAILISSHNLAELENLITDVCIIKNGEIISNTEIEKLKTNNQSRYLIELDKLDNIDELLKENDKKLDSNVISIEIDKSDIPEYIKTLIFKGYKVYSVVKETISLEEAYINTAGGNIID